jgi:hypothetical protein
LDLEWELLDEASSIAPTTLGAFVCKARILDICREHGDLAASIVDDLVAWPTAKLSANQKAVRS